MRRYGFLYQGFTLIEMMLVILIIGVMASLAVFTVGGNEHRELRNEAGRLHMLLVMASDEAIFQGVDLGFQFEKVRPEDGNRKETIQYQIKKFVHEDGNPEWRDYESMKEEGFPEAFGSYQLPAYIKLEIELDDDEERVSLMDMANELKALEQEEALENGDEDYDINIGDDIALGEEKEPSLVLDSSGEVTPFKIFLTLDLSDKESPTYVIESDGISAISMENKGD